MSTSSVGLETRKAPAHTPPSSRPAVRGFSLKHSLIYWDVTVKSHNPASNLYPDRLSWKRGATSRPDSQTCNCTYCFAVMETTSFSCDELQTDVFHQGWRAQGETRDKSPNTTFILIIITVSEWQLSSHGQAICQLFVHVMWKVSMIRSFLPVMLLLLRNEIMTQLSKAYR